jgi:ribosomal protein S18 acetylase RimI-like enzyme
MAEIVIRSLHVSELEEARILLAQSFMEDPTIAWMLQKEVDGFAERVKTYMHIAHQCYVDNKMPIIGALVNGDLRGVLYGECYENADLVEAVHRWDEQIKNSFTGTVLQRALDYEESMRDEIMPHTYLLGLIAVAKHARGRGIGSALVKHIIAMCKENKSIDNIMLDTANIRNIDLYERLGFKSIAVKAFDENFLQTVMVYSLRQS